MKQAHDYVIIGGGIVGLNIAQVLRERHPKAKIRVLEKESRFAYHASGRNSGVLHAGFYYTADSLKAKLTLKGNQYWTSYCKKNKLRINKCGKLVVARNEEELSALDVLLERGKRNGVYLEKISEAEAKKIEPRVLTHKYAIFSPLTASVDPVEISECVAQNLKNNRVEITLGAAYVKRSGRNEIQTKTETLTADYFINAAGLYADTIAHDFGYASDFRMLPFKGLYLLCDKPVGALRTHIYPVPNLANPFLGVHHTLRVDGTSDIGPTAIPAFWKENYSGLSRFRFGEFQRILRDEAKLFFFAKFNFRQLALSELRKYSKKNLVNESSELLRNVELSDYRQWGKPGIRAQLFNVKTNALEMDFKMQGGPESMHVLNAVSPAFTAAYPFAEYVCDEIERLRNP